MGISWITPVEVTPGTTGSYVDVDLSSNIAAGSTGVFLHIVNNSASNASFAYRCNGSTDDRYVNINAGTHKWLSVGCDANRIIEVKISNSTNIDIYLVGYVDSAAYFYTNATDISLTTTGSWVDIDLGVDQSAIGAVIEVYNISGTNYSFGLRKNGSTDNRASNSIRGSSRLTAFIGTDANEILEGRISNTAVDFFLTGYIKSDATFLTNATDLSLTAVDTYTDLTTLPEGATGGFIEILASGAYAYHIRKNGSSEDLYYNMPDFHDWATVECDTSQLLEGEISHTDVDFFLVGYATSSGSTTQKALTATVNATASAIKQAGKALSTTANVTSSIVRQTGKSLSATITTTASNIKSVGKSLLASVSATATEAYTKMFYKTLTATITTTSSMLRGIGKVLAGNISITGTIVRGIAKTLASTVVATASKTASTAKSLLANVSITATESFTNMLYKTLTASITATSTMTKGINKVLTASNTATSSITKGMGKTLTATANITATMTKGIGKILSATLNASASFVATLIAGGATVYHKTLTATVSLTASMTRKAKKVLTGTLSITSDINIPIRRIKTITLEVVERLLSLVVKERTTTLTATERTTELEVED